METIQTFFHTSLLRNNAMLETCVKFLSIKSGIKSLRILSFGCSVGDEVASLIYCFPDSIIFGCDINTQLLDRCFQTFGTNKNIRFFESNEQNIIGNGPYDIIIASAVLCRNPSPPNYGAVFPFAYFDNIIGLFDSVLKNNGLLCIPNAGYMFKDSKARSNYRPIRSDIMYNTTFVDVLHKDGSIFLKQEKTYGGQLYSRHGNWHSDDDEDLFDCVYEKNSNNVPEFLTLRPVPGGLRPILTYCRKNTDYCPTNFDENFVVVEHKIDIMIGSTGDVKGYSSLVGWSSFRNSEIYYRKNPVWFPAAR